MASGSSVINYEMPLQMSIEEIKYHRYTTLSVSSAWSIVYRLNEIKKDISFSKKQQDICEDIVDNFLAIIRVNNSTQKSMCRYLLGCNYKGVTGEIPKNIPMHNLRHDLIFIRKCFDIKQLIIALHQRINHLATCEMPKSFFNYYNKEVFTQFQSILFCYKNKILVNMDELSKPDVVSSPVSLVSLSSVPSAPSSSDFIVVDKSRDPRLRKRENDRKEEISVPESETKKHKLEEILDSETSSAKRVCAPEPIVIPVPGPIPAKEIPVPPVISVPEPNYESSSETESVHNKEIILSSPSTAPAPISMAVPVAAPVAAVVPIPESTSSIKEKIFSDFAFICFKNGISLSEFIEYINKTK
jgi:hypothetical protein